MDSIRGALGGDSCRGSRDLGAARPNYCDRQGPDALEPVVFLIFESKKAPQCLAAGQLHLNAPPGYASRCYETHL